LACAGCAPLREGVFRDPSRLGIEPPQQSGALPGVPHGAIRSDRQAVRARSRSWRGIVHHLAALRVQLADVAVALVGVPHGAIGSDGGIVRKVAGTGDDILDNLRRRAEGGSDEESVAAWAGSKAAVSQT
jgi:hypothetical protein